MSELASYDLWVEVDLSALRHNFAQVRAFVGENVRVMAVVKANAYGHGYARVARVFQDSGAYALAVTRIEEGLILREAGIEIPIVLLAPVQADNIRTAIQEELHMTVCEQTQLELISKEASALGKKAFVHVKIDTGMGRLGLSPNRVVEFYRRLSLLPNVTVAGTYTHFATAAERSTCDAEKQLELFKQALSSIRRSGLGCGLVHCANSAAILRMPDSHFDMIRPGTLLYGQYPSRFVPRMLQLRSTWKLKARICHVRELPKGAKIGYGGDYTTRRPAKIAVIPVGYADGFTLVPEGSIYRSGFCRLIARRLRWSPAVYLRGMRVAVVGRVGMQLCLTDVTDLPDVKVGEDVEIPAMRIPTNSMIPRVYLE
ncbi:MAG: alanine racemase [Armatimonadota bacterium]